MIQQNDSALIEKRVEGKGRHIGHTDVLTFSTILVNSADDVIFPQNIGFDISCKLSPEEKICMKCDILYSGKNKKRNMTFTFFLPACQALLHAGNEFPM